MIIIANPETYVGRLKVSIPFGYETNGRDIWAMGKVYYSCGIWQHKEVLETPMTKHKLLADKPQQYAEAYLKSDKEIDEILSKVSMNGIIPLEEFKRVVVEVFKIANFKLRKEGQYKDCLEESPKGYNLYLTSHKELIAIEAESPPPYHY